MTKNKNIIKSFLSIIICFGILLLPILFVSASTNDTLGIESNESYYIKNLYTGKYLDVRGGGTPYNGQNVWIYSFNGQLNQQWRIIRNSNGTYKFVSLLGAAGYVLDVTGSNVDILTDNNAYYEQFTIIRNNTTDYGGTYSIKYGSQYVTANTSTNNVGITSSGSGLNSMWSFEKIDTGDADIYAFDYYEGIIHYNSTGANSTFSSTTTSMGFSSFTYNNYSATYPLIYIQYDDIWVHSGHGNTGLMAFRDTNGNWSYITIGDINNFPINKMASERVIITTGCYTAKNTNTNPTSPSNNIIKAIYEKGARFALGWTVSVVTSTSVDWIKNFFNKADNGETVKKCIEYADYWSYCGPKYYYGDTYQKLRH